jgi:8-oxo-dGTP diphosphatase
MTDILVVSAAALIGPDGRVLVQERPAGGEHARLWEFPGGKVEAGESAEAALVRELSEELSIMIDADALRPVSFSTAVKGKRSLVLLLFACSAWRGEPSALFATRLAWATIGELETLSMPAADKPLLPFLARVVARGP